MTVKLHIQLNAITEARYCIQNQNDGIDNWYRPKDDKASDLQFYRAIQLISNMAIDDPERILAWGEKYYSEGNNSETD